MHMDMDAELPEGYVVDLSQPEQYEQDDVRVGIRHRHALIVLVALSPPEGEADQVKRKRPTARFPRVLQAWILDRPPAQT